ncbi:MAG TPA: hypothetical protein VJQ57_09480 [Acidimicrobiia bacterium]|nr:hypothetical protein [Acidimicrobiia bacterium]
MGDVVTIEDDDGFTTVWPIGEGVSALHAASTIDAFQDAHDALRAQWKVRAAEGSD